MVYVFGKCHLVPYFLALMGCFLQPFQSQLGAAEKAGKIAQDANLCWC